MVPCALNSGTNDHPPVKSCKERAGWGAVDSMRSSGDEDQHGMREPFEPGDRVADYIIEYELGRGGMAVVYQAREEPLGRHVALKAMPPQFAGDPDLRARFHRESRAIASIDEPHILPIFRSGETDGGVLYMVTRLVRGGDLNEALKLGGPLPASRTAALVTQIAAALDAAHAVGVVHRDVKPRNILISSGPGGEHAYLADFGITKITWGEQGPTGPDKVMGTPDYMAPEQVLNQPVTGRTDQYGLACTAFELLAGAAPYSGNNWLATVSAQVNSEIPAVTRLRPELPAAVDDVLARGMAKAPGDRYLTCGHFATALRQAIEPALPQAAPDADSEPRHLTPDPARWPVADRESEATSPGRPRGPRPLRFRFHRREVLIAAGTAAVVLAGMSAVVVPLLSSHGQRPASSVASSSGVTVTPAPSQVVTGVPARLMTPSGDDIELPGTFSANGDLVAAVGNHNPDDVYAWSAVTRKYIGTLTLGSSIDIQGLAFTADDKALLVLDSAGGVYRWDLSTGSHPMILADSQSNAAQDSTNAAISGDGGTVAVEDSAGTGVDVYNVSTGSHAELPDPDAAPLVGTDANGQYSSGSAVSLDWTGGVLAVGDTRGNVYIWDVGTRAVLRTLHYNPATTLNRDHLNSEGAPAATLSADGKQVMVADDGADQKDTLWDVATGANITPDDASWPIAWHGAPQVLFCSGGQFIVTEPDNSDGAELWNAATGAYVAAVRYPDNLANLGLDVYAVSPDGRTVLTDDGSKNTFLWSIP
jgi:serine/threonine protein kinase